MDISKPTLFEEAVSRLSLSDQPHVYHTVNISGNARAILGNAVPADSPLQHGSNVEWKNTLKALYFEGMGTRKAQIAERAGSPEYVAWIWETKFVNWLCSNESFFWITGRPGSGKSTLMKHIADSRKTKQHLEQNGQRWTVIHFFFDFRAGSSAPNNLEGMLRSLLYQLVRRCPDLAQYIDFMPQDGSQTMSVVSCLEYICQAIENTSSRVCAFIDGLDEYGGLETDLVETIHNLEDRAAFKICLASRPYQVFESSLFKCANLTMQDFNDQSIQMYVKAQWKNKRLGIQASLPEALGNKIREKSRGVFLWARLAIDELLQDLLRGKTIAALEVQLENMPKEVEDMYQRILDQVPTIVKPETATLLYMIASSNTQSTQVRRLYIALDAYARAQAVQSEMQILPIDLTDETGLELRIINIIGDFIDVSTHSEYCAYDASPGSDFDGMIPIMVTQDGEPSLRRGLCTAVSLTHETLRAFLNGNEWLKEHVVIGMQKINPEHLWLDIYLNELKSTGSVTADVSCRAHYSTNPDWVLPTSSTQFGESDPASESLLDILRGWSTWTPLLTLSVQYLFREIASCHGHLDQQMARKVCTALRVPVMQYHFAICRFQSRCLAAMDDNFDAEGCALGVDDCAYSFPYQLYDNAENIGWEILFSICHGLPEVALHSRLFELHEVKLARIQEIFNHSWTKFVNCRRSEKAYCLWLDRLFEAGARLDGPILCSVLCENYRHEGPLPTFLQIHPEIKLTHADDCGSKGCEDKGSAFLDRWVNLVDYSTEKAGMLEVVFALLLRSGVQLDTSCGNRPLLNRILASDANTICCMVDRMKKIILALRAGADPNQRGIDGNALQAARALSVVLHAPPEEYRISYRDPDYVGHETTFETQTREVTKIVDMLDEYTELGSLTESQFAAYGRFNSRSAFQYRTTRLHVLNPYNLFQPRDDQDRSAIDE